MTDSGTPDRPTGPTGPPETAETAETTGATATPAGHRRRRGHRRLRWTALVVLLVVLGGAATAWGFYRKLDGNIHTDAGTARELHRHEAERPARGPAGAQNILLLGSDDRGGRNSDYGRDIGRRSDTAILLHVSADHRSATGVSIPRDLMVHIPACTRPDGSRVKARFAQFNWAFSFGGPACTIRTVEKLTGARVDHHLVLDFTGFKELVDAVGGVEICVPRAVHSKQAGLDLPAGRQTLHGEEALSYVRARYGIGNGSDTERIGRQQQFLAALVRKVRSNGVLLNPGKLYPVLNSATSALTADSGLDSLTELYDFVRDVRKIPEDRVHFLTVPRQPYVRDHNRDQLVQPDARRLFAQLREDRSIAVAAPSSVHGDANEKAGARGGASAEPAAFTTGPASAYRGITATHDICTADGEGNGVN